MSSTVDERKQFLLPDLGEGLTEGEIVRWWVEVGDAVAVDQVVAEVETAKATVEVPCPYTGIVAELHGRPGDVIDVGAPLISITETGTGSGSVLVGYGTSPSTRRRRRKSPPAATAKAAAAAPPARPLATPPVRKLAKDLGVTLATVTGTGRDGVITRNDVEAAAASPAPTTPAASPSSRIDVRGVRRAVGEKLSRSHREIPQVTTWVDADASGLLEWRRHWSDAHPGTKITPLALVLRICVAGLARFPVLNASYDAAADQIVTHEDVHLGVASQTERGLLAPVLRNAHLRDVTELASELERLGEGARAATLKPDELTGSTFTVSNFGVFGVDGGTPIINYPEAAILGMGRIADRPWVHQSGLAIRPVVQLTLGFDHRVTDGTQAAGFLRFVADCVEQPLHVLS